MIEVALAAMLAQAQCGNVDKVIDSLTRVYGEQLVFGGDAIGIKFRMYVNTRTSTWTAIGITGAMACIVAAGKDFRFMFAPIGKDT
ncbi:MAG: hypothetical protein ACREJC_11465 [Tepidisphaeraceae bacterium]